MNTKDIIKEFDKKFLNDLFYNQFHMRDVKQFIISKLEAQQHDHEILINTILEDNKRKIKEQLGEVRDKIEKLENGDEFSDGVVFECWKIINNKIKELE